MSWFKRLFVSDETVPTQTAEVNSDSQLEVHQSSVLNDDASGAAIGVAFEHHEIHEGDHFFIQEVVDIPINNVFDMQWTTPNTTKWEHFTFKFDCESETEWWIYEGASISVAGSSITPRNNNRNSANASTAVVAQISNTSIANANADTPVAGATVIAHGISGAGKTAGVASRQSEIILKQNTIYCFRAVANTAGFVNFDVEWYEHTNL